ncbi:hypothetical protein BP5796_05726 [Coleophoma crateriformis]|uniref:Integral membrane protein n=1 Tax=Coleophoma crateriformis TaxID=565419 RepID=A0A3D8RVI1_9HELO|nr:hypothetical protein BP5796_05726 [Coleophoma crateriformis]
MDRPNQSRAQSSGQIRGQSRGLVSSSFLQSLDVIGTQVFAQWPNFTVEEEYRIRFAPKSNLSSNTFPALLFFPKRSSLRYDNGSVHQIKRMLTRFPISDTSYLVASIFTVGAAIFVANGFFLLLPIIAPQLTFNGEATYAVPVTSVVGTFLFNMGGYAGWLEGLNWKRGGTPNMTDGGTSTVTDVSNAGRKLPDVEEAKETGSMSDTDSIHGILVPRRANIPMATTKAIADEMMASPTATWQPALIGSKEFVWWPTTQQFRRTYRHDPVFWAGLVQWIGTIVFAIATVVAVPGVIDFSNQPLFFFADLLPATLGGVLFVVAGLFQLYAAQKKWYLPAFRSLTWHTALWNTIGSVGFALAGGLLYISSTAATFQATLATFWGSSAFLIGGLIQWYSVMGNYP